MKDPGHQKNLTEAKVLFVVSTPVIRKSHVDFGWTGMGMMANKRDRSQTPGGILKMVPVCVSLQKNQTVADSSKERALINSSHLKILPHFH